MGELPICQKIAIALRTWFWFGVVHVALRRRRLPEVVERLGRPRRKSSARLDPARLGRMVRRVLAIGPLDPRCLLSSLVLFRLLRAQGDPAQLVIGLPAAATGKDAHAWIEVAGRDVGPPPGRARHEELARYG